MRQETLVAEDAADRLLVSEATRPIDRRIRHRSPSFANPQQLLRRRGYVLLMLSACMGGSRPWRFSPSYRLVTRLL